MNTIKEDGQHQRKAISPIIATVLIIAITLIAAVAIGGFVFGLFGSSTNTAQVAATSTSVPSTLATTGFTAACAAATGANGFVALYNSGTVPTTVTLAAMTYGGSTYTVAPTGGTLCSASAGSTIYIQISALGATVPSKGAQFTGYVATSNGAQVVFAGAFT